MCGEVSHALLPGAGGGPHLFSAERTGPFAAAAEYGIRGRQAERRRRARSAFLHLEPELVPVEVAPVARTGRGEAWLHESRRGWVEEAVARQGTVRLLPAYDPYLLGYRSRDHVVSAEHARRIHPGGGFLRPTVILDGWAVGTWRSARKEGGIEVAVEPFEALGVQLMAALEAEVGSLGRFHGGTGSLRILE